MHRNYTNPREAGSVRIFLVTAVLLLCLAVIVFLRLGTWLVREDPLVKCRAVVVLSGGMPVRAVEAAKIYREGYAAEIWLTSPAEPKRSMAALGISFQGEEEGNRQILVRQGVPEKAIHVLSPDIVNTADELQVTAEAMKATKNSGVLVVTSKVHTRRVRALWNRLEGGEGQIAVRAAEDSFDPGHWWRTTQGALDVVREVLGLLNVWAGLPLKPAGQS